MGGGRGTWRIRKKSSLEGGKGGKARQDLLEKKGSRGEVKWGELSMRAWGKPLQKDLQRKRDEGGGGGGGGRSRTGWTKNVQIRSSNLQKEEGSKTRLANTRRRGGGGSCLVGNRRRTTP